MTSPQGPMLDGVIKSLKRIEGYGFITHTATGIDHFFHRSAVARVSGIRFEDLEIDQPVEFVAEEGKLDRDGNPLGPRAINVNPL